MTAEPAKKPEDREPARKYNICMVCHGAYYGPHPFRCSSPNCRMLWAMDREEIERHNQ